MIFPNLPNLQAFAAKHKLDLSSSVLFGVQHLLGTNGSLLEQLCNLGLAYERMFLIGKPYSTNEEVFEELVSRGVHCHPRSLKVTSVNLLHDYRQELRSTVEEMLPNIVEALNKIPEGRNLILIDDGGVLITAVNEPAANINAQVIAVEQTRSGAELLHQCSQLSFPVINVAESDKKLNDESPFIAASVIKETEKRWNVHRSSPLKESSVLIVGHGAIGSQVAQQIKGRVKDVLVYDINPQSATVGKQIELLDEALHKADLIIGCVGKAWMPATYRDTLKHNVLLASASSANIEFLGININHPQDKAKGTTLSANNLEKIHSDYSFDLAGGKGWVLNGGFPVNFDGSVDPIQPRIIELTRMLMFAGITQALSLSPTKGLIDLKSSF